MPEGSTRELPRLFYDNWPRRHRPAAHALWHWHSALVEPRVPAGGDPDAYFDQQRNHAKAGKPLRVMDESTWSAAYGTCSQYGLDLDLLAAQVDAARYLHGQTRFETADRLETFVRLWALAHARLLTGLARVTNSVQIGWIDELARGFFHAGRLLCLPADLAQDRLFLPLEELRQRDVTVEQLGAGRVDEGVRRLLWKHTVRIRDALAQGRPVIQDLGVRQRWALKRYWVGTITLLNEVERRDFDVWSEPVQLSLFRKTQVYLQMVFGQLRT